MERIATAQRRRNPHGQISLELDPRAHALMPRTVRLFLPREASFYRETLFMKESHGAYERVSRCVILEPP